MKSVLPGARDQAQRENELKNDGRPTFSLTAVNINTQLGSMLGQFWNHLLGPAGCWLSKAGRRSSLCMQRDETDWGRFRTTFVLHSKQTTIETHWNKKQVRPGNKPHLKLPLGWAGGREIGYKMIVMIFLGGVIGRPRQHGRS